MSKIEWTNETYNPIIGCSKVSHGCANCYAEKMAYRLAYIEKTEYYSNVIGVGMNRCWTGTTHFVESQLQKPLKWKKPRMIFVCSMGDLFHESVSFEWIDKVFSITQKCPQHTFQILTKRPEIMQNYFESRNIKHPYLNVWLGTTIENQDQIKRARYLLKCPAKVHFISVEPMLSVVDLNEYYFQSEDGTYPFKGVPCKDRTKLIHLLDWVICGGESGHNARPVHPDWVRNLKDQCEAANVPFFFKQWGEYTHFSNLTSNLVEGYSGGKISKMNGEFYKVGKKKAGCLIDGKEYKQFPKG